MHKIVIWCLACTFVLCYVMFCDLKDTTIWLIHWSADFHSGFTSNEILVLVFLLFLAMPPKMLRDLPIGLKMFFLDIAFLYPLKISENRRVFKCFQEVKKRNIWSKWINNILQNFCEWHKKRFNNILQNFYEWHKKRFGLRFKGGD